MAEKPVVEENEHMSVEASYQTTPYAPSPTTSWMSYCSETLKEILRAALEIKMLVSFKADLRM
jgi:hypothetical protein